MNVFLFGNGTSREGFDISSLAGKGLLVGCNWAFQEYPFDVICSADPEVSKIISKKWPGDWIRRDDYSHKGNNRDNVYWNTHDELICTLPKLSHGLGWNTGRAAIYALSKKFGPERIYLFGFDLGGSNLYVDIPTDRPPDYEKCWNFLFNQVDCTRVGPVDDMTKLLTCEHMTYEEFSHEIQRDRI